MSPETISLPDRVILCIYCGNPVHPPKNILRRANSLGNEESSSTEHLLSRVFLLRCGPVSVKPSTPSIIIDGPVTPASQESGLK